MILDDVRVPIVLSPMAGGPSTPELAVAVSEAGGLGFLAAGYLDATEMSRRIARIRSATAAPFGVNLFVPGAPTPPDRYARYLGELGREFSLGSARFATDDWDAKLNALVETPIPVASFAFGCPVAADIARLHAAGTEVWVTVTSVAEARLAAESGADVLIAQGAEAGGHRAGFTDSPADDGCDPLTTLALLQLLTAAVSRPIVAAGGIATGAGIAAVLAAGAAAAQLGTAFLRCPEAGTVAAHREALALDTPTMLTRAFTGRRARGLRNRFILDHPDAPSAYPEIHYATGPLRQAARTAGDAENINMWSGQAHSLITGEPAAELVGRLARETKDALEAALSRKFQSC
ncbi:nitronate monooxygenase [Nocardia sp. alder85J]|uniref:nitronate monooxygenase n=1 Tax=Nocardia sp. alder85J TaxID=2862949 RepID=UPI001CD5688E|nr:nitronate monooxygenase [Nocardia sp. alder85J]MCX4093181.1 nitronate monooxygenase [Nocardia sp. alder85J]